MCMGEMTHSAVAESEQTKQSHKIESYGAYYDADELREVLEG